MAEYCLRWNNHQPNLVTVFSELLTSEALVDVTLATDGQFIQAHKLVLSACSAYFKDLFGSNPCTHPIVFLKDIRFEDLRTVVDFIYKGEVNVLQERLQDVLKTAESLKIKGLADKPLNFDEHSSQSRGHHLSSSFSSQRSSLTDSREHVQSLETEEGPEASRSSPPAYKRRKVTPQGSAESVKGTNNQEEEERNANSEKDDQARAAAPSSTDEDGKANSSDLKEIKKENDLSHSEVNPEYQESRAADAMLLLQGSSSENEGGGGGSIPSSNSIRSSDASSNVLGAHSQGRGMKRGLLQRQPGIIREVAAEEQKEEFLSHPEYIVPDSITVSFASTSIDAESTAGTIFSSKASASRSKLLQVPAVMVGTHEAAGAAPSATFSSVSASSSISSSNQSSHSKPLLVVPTSGGSSQMAKQSSLTEPSRSYYGEYPPITKRSSHPGVLTHTTTVSSERSSSGTAAAAAAAAGSSSGNQVALIPMHLQLIAKQKSSPGSLPSAPQSHLRPIQPKPCTAESEYWSMKKDMPIIQLTYTEDDLLPYAPARLPRAISEEPSMTRTVSHDPLLLGTSPLIQSVSQDTGLDATIGMSRLMPPTPVAGLSVGRSSTGLSPVSHTPVLREGPALGCNYCWNTQDTQGRVQRRKTKYHCPDCRTNLCIVPCFHEYHNQIQVKQDQHKQITKILTKTSSM